nr:phage portal protein [Brevibacillus laterosporus]
MGWQAASIMTVTGVTTDLKTGEVWYVTTLHSGEQRKIPWFDLLHLKAISKTGLKGISSISVIREKIGIKQASDKFIGAFYANGTTSRGILKVPDILQPEAKDRARTEWLKLNSGKQTDLWGILRKRAQGAFTRSLEENTVKALWNHRTDYVLGSTQNQTLRLSEDDIGLRFELDLPNNTWGKDVTNLSNVGMLTGVHLVFMSEKMLGHI